MSALPDISSPFKVELQPSQIFEPMIALMNAANNDSINFSTLVASLKLGWIAKPLLQPTVKNLPTPGPEHGCITTLSRFVEGVRFLALATTSITLGELSGGNALHDMLQEHHPDLHLQEEDTRCLLKKIERFLDKNPKPGSSPVSKRLEDMAPGDYFDVETSLPSEENWEFEYTWNSLVVTTLAGSLKSFRVTAMEDRQNL